MVATKTATVTQQSEPDGLGRCLWLVTWMEGASPRGQVFRTARELLRLTLERCGFQVQFAEGR